MINPGKLLQKHRLYSVSERPIFRNYCLCSIHCECLAVFCDWI